MTAKAKRTGTEKKAVTTQNHISSTERNQGRQIIFKLKRARSN